MKIYTKTGDKGETSLLSGERIGKDHIRVETYGTLDEAGAALGLAKSLTRNQKVATIIHSLQEQLFGVNADLALESEKPGRQYKINAGHVAALESLIDLLEKERFPQQRFGFVIAGAYSAGAALDLSRTIVRRAERRLVQLQREFEIPRVIGLYLNRLSDLLFVLARYAEQEELVSEITGKVMRALATVDTVKEGNQQMLEKAKQMIAAAEKKAIAIGVPMVIAIADGAGNLVALHRMDESLLASLSIAPDKAYTAVALKMPTQQAAALCQPGASLYGLNTTNQCRIVIFGGGIPIEENGKIIGAIGVSGGAVEDDVAVAEAGLAAWKS